MKKTNETDKQCVVKILRYIKDMAIIFNEQQITSHRALEQSTAAKYAATQLITNIYELTKHMQESTLKSLATFAGINLKTSRQIASHNYAAIEFRAVYDRCVKLIADPVRDELCAFLEDSDG